MVALSDYAAGDKKKIPTVCCCSYCFIFASYVLLCYTCKYAMSLLCDKNTENLFGHYRFFFLRSLHLPSFIR